MKKEDISRQLSPFDRKRKISVAEAAALNNVHPHTFLKNYRHLVRQISARRNAVELGDALDLPPPKKAKSA